MFWNKFLSSVQGGDLFTKIIRMIVWKKIVKKFVFGAVVGIIKIVLSDPQRNEGTRQKKFKKILGSMFCSGEP